MNNNEEIRKELAAKWKSRKIELAQEIGVKTLERARPVFDAFQEQVDCQIACNEAVQLYESSVSDFNDAKANLAS